MYHLLIDYLFGLFASVNNKEGESASLSTKEVEVR
jgi:hypothetical protein